MICFWKYFKLKFSNLKRFRIAATVQQISMCFARVISFVSQKKHFSFIAGKKYLKLISPHWTELNWTKQFSCDWTRSLDWTGSEGPAGRRIVLSLGKTNLASPTSLSDSPAVVTGQHQHQHQHSHYNEADWVEAAKRLLTVRWHI